MVWKMATATYPCPIYTDENNKRRFLHIFGLVNINQFTGWAVERGELVRDAY